MEIFLLTRNFRLLLFCVFISVTNLQELFAQCPATIAITSPATVEPATCPSNGSFTIHDNGTASVAYQITAGPAGFPPGAQNNATFTDLVAGNYQVKVYCQLNPSVSTTEVISVPDQYIDVTASSITSNVCTGAMGGTITTSAQNGNPPYEYAYFQGDPGVADNDPSVIYGASNTFNAPAFGTYNVRTKDDCGVFVTHQISIERSYPSNLCIQEVHERYDGLTCAELESQIYLNITFQNGVNLSSLPAAGVDMDIYLNTGTCASPMQGTLASTLHIDQATYGSGRSFNILAPNNSNLLLVVRTPCGDVCTFCYEYVPLYHDMELLTSIQALGCPAVPGDPPPYQITADVNFSTSLPITYEVRNSSNAVVGTYVATTRANTYAVFAGLPQDTYSVTATDACGVNKTQILAPAAGTPGTVTAIANTLVGCASMNGRTVMDVTIDGTLANLAGSTVTIVAPSPSNVGETGEQYLGTHFRFYDAIPGATYTVEINNNCGDIVQATVNVPLGNEQNQFITTTVQQLCGGTGNVTVSLGRLGPGNLSFDLINSANAIVGSGVAPGGTFANLPPGTYHAIAHVTNCREYDFSSSDVVILPGGSLPVITKELGIICEDGAGTPGGTGKTFIAFYGAQPLKVDYRLTSGTDADYINLTNDSDGTETIDGLTAGTSYTIRVTDACGNSNPIQVSIGQLGAVTTESSDTPCLNEPYTLAVPDMVDATYAWTKDGTPVSNERQIAIPTYMAGDNGVYQCTIVIGGCVTRIVNATLLGIDCANPVTLAGFSAQKENMIVNLKWATTQESNADRFEIERSNDAKSWQYLGEKKAAGESQMLTHYDYRDVSPLSGVNYYRLKMIDKDASLAYSRIVSTELGDLVKTATVYPNPVTNVLYIQNVELSSITEASIINAAGKTLYESNMVPTDGINVKAMAGGMYFLKLQSLNGSSSLSKFMIAK